MHYAPSAQLSKINWTLEWEYLPGIVRFHLWGQLPFHCCYPMLYFLQQYVSCRDLGAKNLLYWPCTYSMLLNQQVQGILYHVFESKSVLKVYLFKSSANGTNNTVKNGRHMEMMSKAQRCAFLETNSLACDSLYWCGSFDKFETAYLPVCKSKRQCTSHTEPFSSWTDWRSICPRKCGWQQKFKH